MISLATLYQPPDWSALETIEQAMAGAVGLVAVSLLLAAVFLKRKKLMLDGARHG